VSLPVKTAKSAAVLDKWFLRMNATQAKDFLVQQTTEQAALEHASLSNIEKRRMYFAESDPSLCDDPFEVNDGFEAQYDTAE
jgi:hypothetical protein